MRPPRPGLNLNAPAATHEPSRSYKPSRAKVNETADDQALSDLLSDGMISIMKPTVYVETSIVSYLAARPSRDLLQAARQQITWVWWDGREPYECFASQLVLRECKAGDPGRPRLV